MHKMVTMSYQVQWVIYFTLHIVIIIGHNVTWLLQVPPHPAASGWAEHPTLVWAQQSVPEQSCMDSKEWDRSGWQWSTAEESSVEPASDSQVSSDVNDCGHSTSERLLTSRIVLWCRREHLYPITRTVICKGTGLIQEIINCNIVK